jgi:hypothetical protein
VKAEVARFYSWTDDYIMGLSLETFNSYYKAITVVKAAECLSDLNNLSYPHQKEQAAKKYVKDLRAHLSPYQKKVDLGEVDLSKIIGGL